MIRLAHFVLIKDPNNNTCTDCSKVSSAPSLRNISVQVSKSREGKEVSFLPAAELFSSYTISSSLEGSRGPS